ncbi:hypothetical protein PCASD_18895 [Puccinia coronata f. sp. avenae]|uniref:Cyanovirin-N domain-containing protein n=1 Tax=Puccinia coronata f. sp. avenae TaxID=200324 RepID=A0A2N5TWT8_9BASI|nr:hypothetical protein PCASD_18895 [Puccinia coronata f. sp. avenae]
MTLFNLKSSTFVAVFLFIVLSSTSSVASLALERRDGDPHDTSCNSYCNELVPHDCNVAFYNLPFEGDNKILKGDGVIYRDSGTCRVSVDCHGESNVSAGRLLNKDGQTPGFTLLQNRCTSQGQSGQTWVDANCYIKTELLTYH